MSGDLLSTQQLALAAGCSASFIRSLRDHGRITPVVRTSKTSTGKSGGGPVTPDMYSPAAVEDVVAAIEPRQHPTSAPEQWRRRPLRPTRVNFGGWA